MQDIHMRTVIKTLYRCLHIAYREFGFKGEKENMFGKRKIKLVSE